MRADLFEVPLNECRKKYAATGLPKLPDNLRQTQICATNKNADGTIADACQGGFNFYLRKYTVCVTHLYSRLILFFRRLRFVDLVYANAFVERFFLSIGRRWTTAS